jgi:hypothetical protein
MTALDNINKHLTSLSDESSKIHRECFLDFVKNLGAASAEVTTSCKDGRHFDAVFHTATPFVGKDFRVCLKATRAKVCDCISRDAPRFNLSFAKL